VVPADLLREAVHASLVVETGDPADGIPLKESTSIGFEVIPRDPAFSVAPTSAVASSSDVTIMVHEIGLLQ